LILQANGINIFSDLKNITKKNSHQNCFAKKQLKDDRALTFILLFVILKGKMEGVL